MTCERKDITLRVTNTSLHCPIGEKVGQQALEDSKTPVLSCEGACIRGEIARQAANMIAREEPYGRGCHGELMTVPQSAISRWINAAGKVVVVDGCFLRCHGRILENHLAADQLIQFDALSVYKKYNDIFNADDVAEPERMATARKVADHVLDALSSGVETSEQAVDEQGCGGCG